MKRKLFRIAFPVILICALLAGCGSPSNHSSINESIQPETPTVVDSEVPKEVETSVSPEPVSDINVALIEQTYNEMQNPTDYLSITNNGYTVKGYPISKDSVCKIGDQLVVNQGVIYEEIAAGLSLYCDYGLSQVLDEAFFQILIGSGEEPENWDELAHTLNEFILADGSDREIISKLETLSCVDGTFDYEARNYEFAISDLDQAINELHISDEMFGHVLAKLSEYPADIVFDGNSLTCSLIVKTYGQ